jgi:hypothetical protein
VLAVSYRRRHHRVFTAASTTPLSRNPGLSLTALSQTYHWDLLKTQLCEPNRLSDIFLCCMKMNLNAKRSHACEMTWNEHKHEHEAEKNAKWRMNENEIVSGREKVSTFRTVFRCRHSFSEQKCVELYIRIIRTYHSPLPSSPPLLHHPPPPKQPMRVREIVCICRLLGLQSGKKESVPWYRKLSLHLHNIICRGTQLKGQ